MATIRQLKTKRWQAIIRRQGTPNQYKTFVSQDDAMKWAQENEKTTVLTIPTDAFEWTPGDADWDVGVPQISDRKEVNEARDSHDVIRSKQRIGV